MTLTSEAGSMHDLAWYADVPRSIRKHAIIGLTLTIGCFGAFGVWGATAPLAAAVITQGTFVATGQNKIVQHLEGGIIKDLLVNEGDFVKVNQPLVRLDETTARVNERQVFLRRLRLEGIVARLSGEAEGLPRIEFPKIILDNRKDDDVESIIASQDLNFQASRSKLNSEIALVTENITSLKFRAKGFQDQGVSMRKQLALLEEERVGKQQLLEKGLLRKTEIKAIERAIADAEGQVARLDAEVAETNSQISKLDRQVEQTVGAYKQAALDELQRSTILSPVAGTVAGRRHCRAHALPYVRRHHRKRQEHHGDSARRRAADHRDPGAAHRDRQCPRRPEGDGASVGAQPAHHAGAQRRDLLRLGRLARRPVGRCQAGGLYRPRQPAAERAGAGQGVLADARNAGRCDDPDARAHLLRLFDQADRRQHVTRFHGAVIFPAGA